MKDALGHGSGSHGEFLEPGAHSIMPSRRDRMVRQAELQSRLSAPKVGLAHAFLSSIKDAVSGGNKLGPWAASVSHGAPPPARAAQTNSNYWSRGGPWKGTGR
jgi:hypothetical protein